MTSEVGNGQVAIFPTFKGFKGSVAKETEGAAKGAASRFGKIFGSTGIKTGSAVGKGFKSAFDQSAIGVGSSTLRKLQSDVASASRVLSTARRKEQDAAGKARVAEAALTEARKKNVAGSARLVAAEERAASAARGLASAQEGTRDASARLSTAQARVRESATEAGAAASRSARSFRGAGSALTGLRSAAGAVSRLFGAGLGLGVGLAAVNALGGGVRRLGGYFSSSISTAAEWATLNAQTGAVIKSTGGAARVTSGHIQRLSQSLENQTATEAEAIQKGANLLLTFTGIRNEAGKGNKIFDQTATVAADMAKALGIDVSAAALQLGKALNDPATGLTKLSRSGVTFTAQQKEQVKALVASGRTMEAQKLILRELNKEFGGSGAAYAKTYAGSLYRVKDAAGDFGASIASALLPAVSKLLGTGADLINWAGGTNGVKKATEGLATVAGKLADKGAAIAAAFKGKNPFENALKIALPAIDTTEFTSGIQGAIAVAKPLLSNFATYVGALGPQLGTALGQVGPILGEALSQIGPALDQAKGLDIIPKAGEAIIAALPSAISLLQALAPLIPPIASIVVSLAPGIKILADGLAFLVTYGIKPLVDAQAGILQIGTAFTQGLSPAQIALDGLSGKFGPVLNGVAIFAVDMGKSSRDVGHAIYLAAFGVGKFATDVGRSIGKAAFNFGAGTQKMGFAAGKVVGDVGAAFGRMVTAIGTKIGEGVRKVGELPGKAIGVLGNLGAKLYGSGAALIQGFIDGIASKIGDIAGVAGAAVAKAAEFFPHSPAKKGAFSGKGWTLYSGRATITDYARGMQQATPTLTRASDAAMRAAYFTATAARATVPQGSSSRSQDSQSGGTFVGNLYLDNGTFLGAVRGEVKAGIDDSNRAISSKQRQGRLKPQFA